MQNSTNHSLSVYDIAVIGAGPAGSAAALAALAEQPLRIALIHSPTRQTQTIGESATPSVTQLIRQLGLNHQLDQQGHLASEGHLSQWGGPYLAEQDFITQGQGHGWHLDRSAFDTWLRTEAEQRGSHILTQHRCNQIGRIDHQHWGIALQTPTGIRRIAARAVIDATGRSAKLARQCGAQRHKQDQLVAISYQASARTQRLKHFSLVESSQHGWWYGAGLPNGNIIVCYMSDADLINQQQINQPEQLATILTQSDEIKNHITPPGPNTLLHRYPANTSYINQVAGIGWIAVGDAALAMDPLTSSGINSALADGIAGAKAILEYLAGSEQALRQHSHNINQTIQRYLIERRQMYQREQRWADTPFWQRRHTP